MRHTFQIIYRHGLGRRVRPRRASQVALRRPTGAAAAQRRQAPSRQACPTAKNRRPAAICSMWHLVRTIWYGQGALYHLVCRIRVGYIGSVMGSDMDDCSEPATIGE